MTLIEFFQAPQNLLLLTLAVTSGTALLLSFLRDSVAGLSVAEATLLINRQEPIIIDVRSESEYQSGHILHAHHVQQNHLNADHSELNKWKDKNVLVYCASGTRSAQACKSLKKIGFTNIHQIKGGIGAWIEAGLPIDKGRLSHHKKN